MKPKHSLRTSAIILNRRNLGEADRVLTLITPANGKLEAVAHGARKPTSRKTGHIELFARVDVLLDLRRELSTVVQAELQEPFLPIREDLTLGAYANYAAELMDRFTQVGQDDLDGLYTLLNDTLGRLGHEPEVQLVMRYYELHLMQETGFLPELYECVRCGEPLLPHDQYFSAADGGVVCPSCGRNDSKLTRLPLNTLKVLRHMQRYPYQQVAALELTKILHQELESLLLNYITYTLESRLQSVDFIRRLRRMDLLTPEL